MEHFKEFVGVAVPAVTVCLLGWVAYYKSRLSKIEAGLKTEKEDRDKALTVERTLYLQAIQDVKADIAELKSALKEGLKEEKVWIQESLGKHEKNIDALFREKVSKEVCEEKHKE
jgi:hypothetical protein